MFLVTAPIFWHQMKELVASRVAQHVMKPLLYVGRVVTIEISFTQSAPWIQSLHLQLCIAGKLVSASKIIFTLLKSVRPRFKLLQIVIGQPRFNALLLFKPQKYWIVGWLIQISFVQNILPIDFVSQMNLANLENRITDRPLFPWIGIFGFFISIFRRIIFVLSIYSSQVKMIFSSLSEQLY